MAEPGITITRVFDAPRERVWKEWTEPERFADWFGGAEAEVPLSTVSMDVRPGGSWRATMFAEPGAPRDPLEGRVSRGRRARAARVHGLRPARGRRYELVTVVLTDLGDGRTEMLFQQRGHMSAEEYERAGQGWGSFFDRIAERLAGQ